MLAMFDNSKTVNIVDGSDRLKGVSKLGHPSISILDMGKTIDVQSAELNWVAMIYDFLHNTQETAVIIYEMDTFIKTRSHKMVVKEMLSICTSRGLTVFVTSNNHDFHCTALGVCGNANVMFYSYDIANSPTCLSISGNDFMSYVRDSFTLTKLNVIDMFSNLFNR